MSKKFEGTVPRPNSSYGKAIADRSQAALEKKILIELGEGARVAAMVIDQDEVEKISLIRRAGDQFEIIDSENRRRSVSQWRGVYHYDAKLIAEIEAFIKKRAKAIEAFDKEFKSISAKARRVDPKEVGK